MPLRQRGNSPSSTRSDGGLVRLEVVAPEVPVAVHAVHEPSLFWRFTDTLLLDVTGL